MDTIEDEIGLECFLPRRSLQRPLPEEDGGNKRVVRTRRRSVRGRRSVANISPDRGQSSPGEQVSLSEVPKCEDRIMLKIQQIQQEIHQTTEYGKDLDIQIKKWETMKLREEANVLNAEKLLSSPVLVSSKKTAFILDKYVRNSFQGCSAAEISQIFLQRVSDQSKVQQVKAKSEETSKLEHEFDSLKVTIEAQLEFLKMFEEFEFDSKIAEFDEVIEEEREWFKRNNLISEFSRVCSAAASLAVS